MANVRYKDHTLLTGGIAAGDVFPMDELVSGSTYQTRRATGAMLQAWALAGVGAAAISNDYNDLDNLPTDLGLVIGADVQAFDADLAAIAALTPSNDDIIQRKAGVWTNRTIAQYKADLSLSGTNTGDQTSVIGNAGTATALQTARNINGVAFDGTADITVTVPAATGISGLGTGVATALAVNVGSAGAFVVNGGALGTPSSGTLTNATGLPPVTGIAGWPANAVGALTNNGSGTLSWAAAGSGITVGTTAITSGTNTKVLFNNSGVVGEYAVTGTGNAVLSASPTLTGTVAAEAATFSDVVSLISTTAANNKITQGAAINIGTTSTDGVILQNTTAAAAGAQQYSPRLRLTGSGWKTTATAAAQTVDWIIENQPVQGAANPSSNLILASQINGGGYSNTLTVGQGTLGITNGVQGTSTLSVSSGSLAVSAGLAAVGNITWGNGWGQLAGGAGSTAIITTAGTIDIRINPTSRNLIIGAADAANPGAQTLSVQSVVAGTSNTAGATWSLQASLGTSQGAPGRLHFKGGALIAASGSTQQTAIDREILAATKVLTNNTVTTVCNVTNASNTVASGFVDYTVEVFDGTDLQIETGYFFYQVTNKGGTIANNTITFPSATGVGVTPTNPKNTTTSGTLAVTWAISAANPALLSVNANSSLTPSTGYPRVTFNLRNTTQQAVAIQ